MGEANFHQKVCLKIDMKVALSLQENDIKYLQSVNYQEMRILDAE